MGTKLGSWTGIAVAAALILLAAACSPQRRDWKKAQESDAEYLYSGYLEKFPQGEHAAEAKAKIEGFAFERALGQDTIDALKEFLKAYPGGASTGKAGERIDDLTWKGASVIKSVLDCEGYLTAYPQGRHAEEARARIKAVLDARPPEWRDVRTVKFVLRQTFDEEVKDVTIAFESELTKFYPFIGIRGVESGAAADAVLTITSSAEAFGASYSAFAFATSGTYYYTGAQVSGRAVLEIPGKKTIREDFEGSKPVPHTISSFGGATEASGAPFNEAMRKDFPRKAGRLLARAFGYVPMVGALGSRDADVISGAVLALQTGGTPALELLLQAVESPDVGVRVNAARALRGHMNAGSIAALVKCLAREGDAEKEVRSAAAESLSRLGVLAIPALAEASKDGKAATREGAALALGGIRTAPSLAILTPLFDDADKSVREAAVRSVGEHKSRAAEVALIDGLGKAAGDDRRPWMAAIEQSLESAPYEDEEEIDTAPAPLEWDRDLISRMAAKVPGLLDEASLKDRAANLFQRFGDTASASVGPMMRAEAPAVRAWAADVLGRIGDAGGLRYLLPGAADADAAVRLETAKSLGQFAGQAGAVEPLGRLFGDASPGVASAALLSLSNLASDEEMKPVFQRQFAAVDKIKILIDKLSLAGTDRNNEKDAAAAILGVMGRGAIGPLSGVLKTGAGAVRQAAVETLGKTGDPQAGPALAELAKDPAAQADNALMAAVYAALGATKSPQGLEILVAGVKDAVEDRQVAAIEALKSLGNIRGVDAIVALLPTENMTLGTTIDTALRELTKFEPEDEKFDWKAWWAKSRGKYGLK